VAPLVGVTDLKSSTHVPCNRLGEDLAVGCHRPLEGEDEGARGGSDSCGLALLGPRILNHAKVRAHESPPLREHRRLLGPGVEGIIRFVARTGVSSVIAARAR
jgi:hypothetical protein